MEKIKVLAPQELISCDDSSRKQLLPVAALFAAVMLWGASFAAMRITLTVLDPWAVMWCRMITALALLVPLAGRLIPRNYCRGDWKLLVPMVLLQPCFYFFLESNALQLTTSSQAGVISASVPLLVSLGAVLFLGESITWQSVSGLGMAMAGVISLTLLAEPFNSASNPLLGNTMEMAAMACAAGNMLIIKRLSSRYNPWSLTAMQVLAGSIFFIPGLFHLINTPLDIWTLRVVMAILFLGVFVTLGAFGLYNWGISRVSAGRASSFINLVPVFAVFTGWSLLGESLTPTQCLAAATVIIGVMVSQRSFRA